MLQKVKQNLLIVIPARYSSTRFPGKPLVDILGKSMIKRVWEKCVEVLPVDQVLVATDDKRIANHCKLNGMKFIMTSKKCSTGTDRLFEVSKRIKAMHYINIQGDEPLISKKDIEKLINNINDYPNYILNAMTSIERKHDYKKNSIPKVVVNKRNELMYMSRSAIPGSKKNHKQNYFRQVCIYSFPQKILKNKKYYNKKTPLEKIEDIEILRFLEHGEIVKMIEVSGASIAVDFPSDLSLVKRALNAKR